MIPRQSCARFATLVPPIEIPWVTGATFPTLALSRGEPLYQAGRSGVQFARLYQFEVEYPRLRDGRKVQTRSVCRIEPQQFGRV